MLATTAQITELCMRTAFRAKTPLSWEGCAPVSYQSCSLHEGELSACSRIASHSSQSGPHSAQDQSFVPGCHPCHHSELNKLTSAAMSMARTFSEHSNLHSKLSAGSGGIPLTPPKKKKEKKAQSFWRLLLPQTHLHQIMTLPSSSRTQAKAEVKEASHGTHPFSSIVCCVRAVWESAHWANVSFSLVETTLKMCLVSLLISGFFCA